MAVANSMELSAHSGQLAGQQDRTDQLAGRFSNVLKSLVNDLWPRNGAAHVAMRTGYSVRQVERCLAGQRRMSADKALLLMFHGDDDGLILEAYLDTFPEEQREKAFNAVRAAVRRVALREELRRGRAELDELERSVLARKSRR